MFLTLKPSLQPLKTNLKIQGLGAECGLVVEYRPSMHRPWISNRQH